MTYRQITLEDRIAISVLRKEGHATPAIAQRLGYHRSTIWRELKRNSCIYDGAYRYSKAQERTHGRRQRSRKGRHHSTEQYRRVNELLAIKYSPEQVSGYLRRWGEFAISHETIYRHVWRDKYAGGSLWQHLRQRTKERRKRHNSHDSRGRLGNKRHIDERPADVETRSTLGHWEIDTVMGDGPGQHCVVSLVERRSGYLLLGKLRCRTTAELNRRVVQLMQREGLAFKTITADNGTEFHGHAEIERRTGVRFYFARPYHSWERGTNENTNGLLRQYLPKGQSMATLTQQQCNAIAQHLNTRPRKRHDYRTPEECIYGL
jgi:IS30 family transposase